MTEVKDQRPASDEFCGPRSRTLRYRRLIVRLGAHHFRGTTQYEHLCVLIAKNLPDRGDQLPGIGSNVRIGSRGDCLEVKCGGSALGYREVDT